MTADRTPRIIRATGKVEPLTKAMPLVKFAEALHCEAFAIHTLPKLGDKPGFVMVCDADGWINSRRNAAATGIYLNNHPQGPAAAIFGDVAIVQDATYGGFYA